MSDDFFEIPKDGSDDNFPEAMDTDDVIGIASQDKKEVYFDEETNKRYSTVLLAPRFPHKKVHYVILHLYEAKYDRYIFEERKGTFGVDKESKEVLDGNLENLVELFKSSFFEYTGLEWNSTGSSPPGAEFIVVPSSFQNERFVKKNKLCELDILPSFLDDSFCAILNSVISVKEITRNWKTDTSKEIRGFLYEWFSKETIHNGLVSLNNIAGFFESNMKNSLELSMETRNFYLRFPHKDKIMESYRFEYIQSYRSEDIQSYRFKDIQDVRNKIRVLEDLFQQNHFESNMSIVSGEERIRVGDDFVLNPLDIKYLSLKNDITKVEKESNEYKLLDEYFTKTKSYSDVVIKNIFRCKRQNENPRLDQPYRLLWHGSSKQNICGILRDSLHLPKSSTSSHSSLSYRHGIFFAECAAKSLGYCGYIDLNNDGFLFLFDVALGDCELVNKAERFTENRTAEVIKYCRSNETTFEQRESETGSEIRILAGVPQMLPTANNASVPQMLRVSKAGVTKMIPIANASHHGLVRYPIMHSFSEYEVHNEKLIQLCYMVQVSQIKSDES